MLDSVETEFGLILDGILRMEKNVRYAAICNKYGEISADVLRDGVQLHLNEYETSKLIREAVSSWHYRHQLAFKLGEGKFALAVYEKLIRLTVPLNNENLLLLTLDGFENVPRIVATIQKLKKKHTNLFK